VPPSQPPGTQVLWRVAARAAGGPGAAAGRHRRLLRGAAALPHAGGVGRRALRRALRGRRALHCHAGGGLGVAQKPGVWGAWGRSSVCGYACVFRLVAGLGGLCGGSSSRVAQPGSPAGVCGKVGQPVAAAVGQRAGLPGAKMRCPACVVFAGDGTGAHVGPLHPAHHPPAPRAAPPPPRPPPPDPDPHHPSTTPPPPDPLHPSTTTPSTPIPAT
jgi:hypothetical protein